MKHFYASICLFGILLCGLNVQAQETASTPLSERIESARSKGVQIADNDLQEMSESEFQTFATQSFDLYRKEKSKQALQIVNGPLITLLSFEEMIALQLVFDSRQLELKKGEANSEALHPLITQLELGFGLLQESSNKRN